MGSVLQSEDLIHQLIELIISSLSSVSPHCSGGLSCDDIFGVQNFVAIYLFDVPVLCSNSLHERRLIYYFAMAGTGGPD